VTGNHNGVIATGGRASYLAIEARMGAEGEFATGDMAAACTNPGAKPTFYSMFFRNAGRLPVYDPTRPLAASIQACPYRWLAAKCSRTVTVGGISYTANRGAPPCTGLGGGDEMALENVPDPNPNQQTPPNGFVAMPRTTGSGTTFRIRIWGKVCEDRPGGTGCRLFRSNNGIDSDGGGLTCVRAHRFGYTATFAPGPDCGPPEWPTGQMKTAYMNGDMRYPPYARWCEFTVTAD